MSTAKKEEDMKTSENEKKDSNQNSATVKRDVKKHVDYDETHANSLSRKSLFGENFVRNQKERVLSGIDSFSTALHQIRESVFNGEESPKLNEYVHKLEGNVTDLKSWVNDLTLDSALNAAKRFSQKRPEVMLIGIFGAGLFLGRFLKSAENGAKNIFTPTGFNHDDYIKQQEVH